MAGVAAYVVFAVRKLGVDFALHHDHLARDVLVRILVACEIAWHVAEDALNAERRAESSHHGANVGRLQQLEILWRGRRRFRGVLRQRGKQRCQSHEGQQ